MANNLINTLKEELESHILAQITTEINKIQQQNPITAVITKKKGEKRLLSDQENNNVIKRRKTVNSTDIINSNSSTEEDIDFIRKTRISQYDYDLRDPCDIITKKQEKKKKKLKKKKKSKVTKNNKTQRNINKNGRKH